MRKTRLQSGLSMIEILIIAAIIGILVIIALSMLPQQISKGRDARRKSDLQKIKIAFENYYSDNDCYPPPEILDNCGSADLSPYLASIPCDPQNKSKYLYAPEGSSCPNYYRVFSNLEVDIDPVVEQLGCHTASGCGAFLYFGLTYGVTIREYNYGVSEGVPVYITETTAPPGTVGFCCSGNPEDQCNGWNVDDGVCADFYFSAAECEEFSACQGG